MNDDLRNIVFGSGLFVWAVILVVIVTIIASFLYLAVYKDMINLKREATQHSNQYIQSKVTELADSYSQWQTLETKKAEFSGNETLVSSYSAQQKALIRRMCNAYHLIPSDIRTKEVPVYIVDLLGECE